MDGHRYGAAWLEVELPGLHGQDKIRISRDAQPAESPFADDLLSVDRCSSTHPEGAVEGSGSCLGLRAHRQGRLVLIGEDRCRLQRETCRQGVGQLDVDRAVEIIQAAHGDGKRNPASAGNVDVLRVDKKLEIWLWLPDLKAIVKILAASTLRIADPNHVVLIGWGHEVKERVLAVHWRAAVVVSVGKVKDRHSVGRELTACGVNLHLVNWLIDGVELRGGIEIARALGTASRGTASRETVAKEKDILVRIIGEEAHLQDLRADHHEVVHAQIGPGIETNAGRARIPVGKGHESLGHAAKRRPLEALSLGIEDLYHRVKPRSQAPRHDINDQALPRPGVEAIVVGILHAAKRSIARISIARIPT